jgi:two-component system chemotaxis response regulator CheB
LFGVASDPIMALDKFTRSGWPDVIILDIEMPRMNGLDFLRKIMAEKPTPVIICSTLAKSGSQTAIEALSSGAVEIIAKPEIGVRDYLDEVQNTLLSAIKSAYASKNRIKPMLKMSKPIADIDLEKNSTDIILPLINKAPSLTHNIIAIGSSTGGVQAIEAILRELPANVPPIMITQHIPQGFSKSLALRLDSICNVSVKEAENGDKLIRGRVLIAPGDKHLLLKRQGLSYIAEVKDGPKVSRHRPSVDVLFRSFANEAGTNATGFILTGMGDDGARGLKEMRDRGAKTYAQDEESSIVFGMPKEAIALGGASSVISLYKIADIICKL